MPVIAARAGARATAASRGTAPPALALAALLGTLSAGSWLALWWWSASPYAGLLHQRGWADAGAFAALCRLVPQGDVLVPAALHALAWLLMLAAMMLPTTFPLLSMFARVVHARPNRPQLVGLVVAGFAAVWLVFGVAAHAVDAALVALASRSPWLVLHGDLVAAAVLAGAGAFQFSALKYRCLEACHAPFAFVSSRWHGVSPRREAWRLGVDHGVFCIGCCWALMLLMFVVGVGSVGWMLAIAVVMAAEKNLPWGRRLRTPLGLALFAAALGLLLVR